jgi:hypothetical protein
MANPFHLPSSEFQTLGTDPMGLEASTVHSLFFSLIDKSVLSLYRHGPLNSRGK